MRYAIVQSGGKQYKAVEGETLEVDTLPTEAGKKVELDHVLLISDGEKVMVGKPILAGAKVSATVVAQDKGPKVTVFKYKPKIRYRVKTGHRQQLTRLMIDSIQAAGLAKSETKPVASKSGAVKAAPRRAKAEAKSRPRAKSSAKSKKK